MMDAIDIYVEKFKKQVWGCAFCGDRFADAQALEGHLRSCHGSEFDIHRNPNVDLYSWSCCDCKETFFNIDDASKHQIASGHDIRGGVPAKQMFRYSCSDCHELFSSKDEAIEHQKRTLHNIMNIRPKPLLGLTPRFIWEDQRIKEISEAIGRFIVDDQMCPDEWFEELAELCKRRVKRNAGQG